MTAFSTATPAQTPHRESSTPRTLTPGWWLLPSVIGGCAVWWQIALTLFG